MLVVAGPPGSGKSRALPLEDTGVDFFNVDDRCYKLNNASYHGIPREIRERANAECERFVDDHILRRQTSVATPVLKPRNEQSSRLTCSAQRQ